MQTTKSSEIFDRALQVMPGGNTRHTIFFPPYPPYAIKAKGCSVQDVDGVEYIDFVNNYSSLIHGHNHPRIIEAVKRQLDCLTAVALPTEAEVNLAELLCDRVPGIAQIRFCNSGTEAVMFAIKAARAVTGRSKIVKVEGCFHGSYDPGEVSLAASPDDWGDYDHPRSVALNQGTPQQVLNDVVIIPFNDCETAEKLIRQHAADLSAVVIDPIPSRMNFVHAQEKYLQMLRDVTHELDILLIFDEVFSFRLGKGGVQDNTGIIPDLTTLGKIIGGGFPVGAFGGSKEVMKVFDGQHRFPNVFHGGTLSGNPISMVAGAAAISIMTDAEYLRLNALGDYARLALENALEATGTKGQVYGQGSLVGLRFSDARAENYREFIGDGSDIKLMQCLHQDLLSDGILCVPSGLFTLSTAMSETEIDVLTAAVKKSLSKTREQSTA